ncbi:MAG: L-fucose isomerase [Kiritimatiellaeota bacterium]|nr:L-fucose isomerase [Kiritimatiellota bacterium]
MNLPDFATLAKTPRSFAPSATPLVGHPPTIAITPVADGRVTAYESNAEKTWRMVEKVYRLVTENVRLPDGRPVRVVVAPEIVYGPRSGARAQEYYATQGVYANIWLSRSWAYSDELMSAAMCVGSSEWQQAAYGLNQTDRPGAVWLKAFCAAMDEKKRPIFSIYSPDLENEDGPLNAFVSERILRFARCAMAAGQIRGKNYLNIGGVSMGILGSDCRRNTYQHYLGMGSANFDMAGLKGRLDTKFYDAEEVEKAFAFLKKNFAFKFGPAPRAMPGDDLIRECARITCIVRDLMVGNEKLASRNVEYAQGYNAIAAGTQGQRQWSDYYPNFDLTESILNASFDWDGARPPRIIATENDSKNGMGMLVGHLLSGGAAQLFADIRTNWTPASVKKACGVDVSKICPNGIIDKRNSGAAALDYAVDIFALAKRKGATVQEVMALLRRDPKLRGALAAKAAKATAYMGANRTYFPGDGFSSHFRTPGGIPMTAYRYNVVDGMLTCSVVEGDTVELPKKAADHISRVTDPCWPETFWTPRGMTSFEYMERIGPNHDGNSFGLVGADFVTLNAMLRIPVDMHNVAASDLFRPTLWSRMGDDDFRACAFLGPLYV